MEIYKNLGGDSGVESYKIESSSITVKFLKPGKDGCNTYEYTYDSAGSYNIEQMKELALRGEGLNSFINTTVKKQYAKKY